MDTARSGTTEETGVIIDLNGILTRISNPNNWTDAFFEEVNKCYSEHFNQIRNTLTKAGKWKEFDTAYCEWKRPGQVQALSAAQEEKLVDQQKKPVCDRGKARTVKEHKPVQSVDASELLSADLPPIIFLVDGMVSQGLGGLSAKSKLGKSWLGLQLAVALARGDKFLGFTTKQCSVLYIDLENAPALTQDRLRKILDGRDLPKEKLYFWHEANMMGNGFEGDLVKFLEEHPGVKLVIIDVFQKVKQGKKQTQTDYEADYEILTKLKQIADKYSICIMPIYHDRKFVDPTDPFANVLGSTAVPGVSDFMWVLFKEKREDLEATLAVTGRTLAESRYKLKRNGVKWENLGDASAVEETRKRREYDNDPLVNTIRKLVRQNGGKWKGRVKEIISSSQYFKGFRIYDSPQKVGKKIKAIEKDLEEYDAIHHSEMPHGKSSSEHVFESENPFEK